MRELAEMLPLQFLRAREEMMRRFRPILHRAGLTETQWRVLRVVHASRSISFAELAERAILSKPNLSRVLVTLEGRGQVDKVDHDDDQRKLILQATGKGDALVAQLGPSIEDEYERMSTALGTPLLERLSTELHEFIDGIQSTAHARAKQDP